MSEFYKPGGEYCRECIGRKGSHTKTCEVPAKENAPTKAPVEESADKVEQ
jgi:hypothetical protein